MIRARLLLISLCVTIAMLVCPAHARADDVVITGVVTSEDKPLAGATVVAWTAAPRTGPAFYCPSCYQDCGTSTVSAEDGTFKLKLVDPQLVWRLLVVKDGYVPQFVRNIDPGETFATVDLVARDWARIPEGRIVRGVVRNTSGEPIANATVEPDSVMFVGGDGRGGAADSLDPLAVTNEKGEFRLAYQGDGGMVDTMAVTVHARAYARKCVPGLHPGAMPNVIVMSRGVTVTGRLVKDGAPVGGAEVGLCPVDWDTAACFAHEEVATFEDGRFLFTNVPVLGEQVVYGINKSIARLGVTQPRRFKAEKEGELIDLGNVEIVPGRRVRGRVQLSDGESIPADAKLCLSSSVAWDSVIVDLPPSGEFDLRAVPDGDCSLNVPLIGSYEMSPRNRSYVEYDVDRLEGRIEGDIDNLTVLMIPKGTGPKRVLGKVRQPIDVPLTGTPGFEGTTEPTDSVGPIGELRLRVVVNGPDGKPEPLAGVAVRVKSKNWCGFDLAAWKADQTRLVEVLTDDRGECVLGGLEPGVAVFTECSKAGYEQSTNYGYPISQRNPTHEVVMVRPAKDEDSDRVNIRVVDAKGVPLRGAAVWIVTRWGKSTPGSAPAAPPPPRVERSQDITGEDGRAWLSIPDACEAVTYLAAMPGHAPVTVERAKPGDSVASLTPGGTVVGRVLSSEGVPLAGAVVRLVAVCSTEGQPMRSASVPVLGSVRSDTQGRFEFTHVAPGVPAMVHIASSSVPAGFASARIKIMTPADDKKADAGVVAPQRGVRLAGRVRFAAGLGWPERPIVSVFDLETRELMQASALDDGRFAFGLIMPGAALRLKPELGFAAMKLQSDRIETTWGEAMEFRLSESLPNLELSVIKRVPEANAHEPPRQRPLQGVER